jgi:hypothetical protein
MAARIADEDLERVAAGHGAVAVRHLSFRSTTDPRSVNVITGNVAGQAVQVGTLNGHVLLERPAYRLQVLEPAAAGGGAGAGEWAGGLEKPNSGL